MRDRAQKLGLKLNEYGLWNASTGKQVSSLPEEEDLFKFLDMPYVMPQNRN
jgi:DNA polymerase/3'-5' exonuclease PolX